MTSRVMIREQQKVNAWVLSGESTSKGAALQRAFFVVSFEASRGTEALRNLTNHDRMWGIAAQPANTHWHEDLRGSKAFSGSNSLQKVRVADLKVMSTENYTQNDSEVLGVVASVQEVFVVDVYGMVCIRRSCSIQTYQWHIC